MKKTLFLALILIGCGYGSEKEKVKIVEVEVPGEPGPGPGPGPTPQPGTSWAEMRGLFDRNCAQCHRNDAFAQNEAAMRAIGDGMIRSRKMPPNANAMSEDDRRKMINFF